MPQRVKTPTSTDDQDASRRFSQQQPCVAGQGPREKNAILQISLTGNVSLAQARFQSDNINHTTGSVPRSFKTCYNNDTATGLLPPCIPPISDMRNCRAYSLQRQHYVLGVQAESGQLSAAQPRNPERLGAVETRDSLDLYESFSLEAAGQDILGGLAVPTVGKSLVVYLRFCTSVITHLNR